MTCLICGTQFETNRAKLNCLNNGILCGHQFHQSCILKWLSRTPKPINANVATCPVCSSPITTLEPVDSGDCFYVYVDPSEANLVDGRLTGILQIRRLHTLDSQPEDKRHLTCNANIANANYNYERPIPINESMNTDGEHLRIAGTSTMRSQNQNALASDENQGVTSSSFESFENPFSECSVCHLEFEKDDGDIAVPVLQSGECNHYGHKKCFIKWIKQSVRNVGKARCSNCRGEIIQLFLVGTGLIISINVEELENSYKLTLETENAPDVTPLENIPTTTPLVDLSEFVNGGNSASQERYDTTSLFDDLRVADAISILPDWTPSFERPRVAGNERDEIPIPSNGVDLINTTQTYTLHGNHDDYEAEGDSPPSSPVDTNELSQPQIGLRNPRFETNYECETCGLSYTSRSGFWRHNRFNHSNIGYYECPVCRNKYARQENFMRHFSRHH